MDAKAIVDSYVGDVVRHLPRKQRNDVALELRSLLDDELAGRAADAGRPADATLTMELLTAFGRPQDVADRYRPTGFIIIRPSDAPRFAWLALGGILLQWAITLPAALTGLTPITGWDYGAGTWWGRLTVWWLGAGLGALWWPGLLITFTLIAALVEHRRESAGKAWRPTPRRAIDRDLVSRPAIVLGFAAALVGASVVVALPSLGAWAPGLPQPVLDALALDPDFLRWRAPWVLVMWAAQLAIYVVVFVAGRWTPGTQRIRGILDLLTLGLMLWWAAGGPIFESAAADSTTKFLLVVMGVISAIDAVVAFRRSSATSSAARRT